MSDKVQSTTTPAAVDKAETTIPAKKPDPDQTQAPAPVKWLKDYTPCRRPLLHICAISVVIFAVAMTVIIWQGLCIHGKVSAPGNSAAAAGIAGTASPPATTTVAAPTSPIEEGFFEKVKMWLGNQENRKCIQQIMFLAAGSFFLAMWVVYFGSKPALETGKSLFKVQSLRRLLSLTTVNFSPYLSAADTAESDDAPKPLSDVELAKILTDKASSSQRSLAMLMTVAILELNFIHNGLLANAAPTSDPYREWQFYLLSVGALASILGLVSVIISADSLDCLFNGFRPEIAASKELPILFYRSTINWRYIGLVSILFAAAIAVGSRSSLFGANALTLIIAAGYYHWFPFFHKKFVRQQGSDKKIEIVIMARPSWAALPLLIAMFSPLLVAIACYALAKR